MIGKQQHGGARPGAGRPAGSNGKDARKPRQIRFNNTELETIKAAADRAGVSFSEFVRLAAIDSARKL